MTLPIVGQPAATLPASWYGAGTYERERQAVFGCSWLVAGHAAQVAAPGDYFATSVAGWNLVVVADRAGTLRAFHNVCRHRAGPLVPDDAGRCGTFVCRYHGWAYELDGTLRAARDFGAEVDAASVGLLAVQVQSWQGLIWVNLDVTAPPLLEALGGFADACAPFAMEQFRFSREVTHDLDCNWKTYADNYLEGYHIPLVHRALNREIDAGRYRVTVGERWCRHEAPTRDGAVNAGRWLWCWPNLAVNLYPDAMNVERFLPLGPHRTRISYRYFSRDGQVDPEVVRMSTTVLEEDRMICEAVQRNLDAGAYTSGSLSPRHEGGVAAFQAWVRQALEGSA